MKVRIVAGTDVAAPPAGVADGNDPVGAGNYEWQRHDLERRAHAIAEFRTGSDDYRRGWHDAVEHIRDVVEHMASAASVAISSNPKPRPKKRKAKLTLVKTGEPVPAA
jgi:hypothetical protein